MWIAPETLQLHKSLFLQLLHLPSKEQRDSTATHILRNPISVPPLDWEGFILPVPLSDSKRTWFYCLSRLILEHINLQQDLRFKRGSCISRGLLKRGVRGGDSSSLEEAHGWGAGIFSSSDSTNAYWVLDPNSWWPEEEMRFRKGTWLAPSHTAKPVLGHLCTAFLPIVTGSPPSPWGEAQTLAGTKIPARFCWHQRIKTFSSCLSLAQISQYSPISLGRVPHWTMAARPPRSPNILGLSRPPSVFTAPTLTRSMHLCIPHKQSP